MLRVHYSIKSTFLTIVNFVYGTRYCEYTVFGIQYSLGYIIHSDTTSRLHDINDQSASQSMPWRLEGFHSGTQIPSHLPKHCEWGLWGPSFGNLTLTTVFPLRKSGFMLVRRKTTRSLQRPSFNQCTSFSALTAYWYWPTKDFELLEVLLCN